MSAEATGTLKVEVEAAPAETELQRIVRASEACATSLSKMAEAQTKVKEETKKTVSAWEGMKQGLKTITDGFAKFGQVMNGVQQAWALLNKVMAAGQFAVDVSKLRTRFQELGGSMERFKDVADEGMTKIEIMRASLQGMTGDVRLTAEGMELVLEAADKWGDKIGKDGVEVTQAFTKAIQTGQVRALKELGIQIEDGADKQKTLNNLLQKYKEIAADDGPENKQLARFERANTAIKDLGDTIKESLGQVVVDVVANAPRVAEAYENAFDRMMFKAEETSEAMRSYASYIYQDALEGGIVLDSSGHRISHGQMRRDMLRPIGGPGRRMAIFDPSKFVFRQKFQQKVWKPLQSLDKKAQAAPLVEGKYAKKRGRGGGEKFADGSWGGPWGDLLGGLGSIPGAFADEDVANAAFSPGLLDRFMPKRGNPLGGAPGTDYSPLGFSDLQSLNKTRVSNYEELAREGYAARMEDARLKGANMEAFKSQLGDTSTALGGAFDALSGGVMAAVDAAITGSESIGKAFAKAASAALKAIAVESTGRAIYHGALALGSLAFGDLKGAGLHAAAAAKFGLAAAGTGILAAGLGSMGAGGGANAGAGAGSQVGGGFGGQTTSGGPRTVIVNVNGFVGGTSGSGRELQGVIVGALEKADRAGTNKRSNTVIFE